MRFILAYLVLRRFNRRRRSRITIEPNPHHIHAVFDLAAIQNPKSEIQNFETVWSWPTSTWMQRRIAQLKRQN